MKRLYNIWLIGLLVLTSCIRTQNVFDSSQLDIAFQPIISSASRANNSFTGESFGAYAWLGADDQGINDQLYFGDIAMIQKEGHPYWEAEPPQYWPGIGFLDFFCYAPYVADGTAGVKPIIDTHDWGLQYNSLTYKDVTVGKDTPDILYSDKTINQTNETTHQGGVGVPVIFNHALAMVKVTVTATILEDDKNYWELTLKECSISNVSNQGSVTLTLNADKKMWNKPEGSTWTPAPGKIENWNMLPIEAERQKITLETNTLLHCRVLPQQLTDDMELRIVYHTITYHKDGLKENEWDKEVKVKLNTINSGTTPITSWEMNKVISYHILITPPSNKKPLIFRPAVDDWTTSPQPLPDISPNDKNN